MVEPRTLLPGVIPLTLRWETPPGLLAGLDSFRAWPSGLACFFVIAARVATLPDGGAQVFEHGITAEWREAGTPPPECVRFSVTFSDGTTISNLDAHGTNPRGILQIGDGGGSAGPQSDWVRYDLGWWLSPLPPPGDLVFGVEWPYARLLRSDARADAEALREAASRAQPLSELTC